MIQQETYLNVRVTAAPNASSGSASGHTAATPRGNVIVAASKDAMCHMGVKKSDVVKAVVVRTRGQPCARHPEFDPL